MLYEQQLQNPHYAALSAQHNISIFGTIDDHDYGCNNADSTFPHKQESARAFVDFLGLPSDSSMRQRAQAGLGVYGVQLFDFDRPKSQHLVSEEEAGIDPDVVPVNSNNKNGNDEPSYSNHTVAVFVLDIRSNKAPWKKGLAAYQPDYQGDFLGEDQWTWFEQALANSRAAVHVVVSGVQVHADRFPNANVAEAWGKFPAAQQRLYDALLNHDTAVPILISGDVHMSQLMRRDCVHKDDLAASSSETTRTPRRHKRQRSLMELTTSGMTHSWGTMSNPALSAIDENNHHGFFHLFATFVTRNTMLAMHYFCPWTDIMIKDEEEYQLGPSSSSSWYMPKLQYSLEKNFGELEFDWDRETVTLRTIGEQHLSSSSQPPILLEKKIHLDELRFLAGGGGSQQDDEHESFPAPGSLLTMKDFVDEAQTRQRANKVTHDNGDWICVNHRGRQSENQVRHIIGLISTGIAMTTMVSTIGLLPLFLLMALIRRTMNRQLHPIASSKTLRSIPMHQRSFP
jgi:hypothetical protein